MMELCGNNEAQVLRRACDLLSLLGNAPARQSHLDLGRAPYVLYGIKYIDPVSLW